MGREEKETGCVQEPKREMPRSFTYWVYLPTVFLFCVLNFWFFRFEFPLSCLWFVFCHILLNRFPTFRVTKNYKNILYFSFWYFRCCFSAPFFQIEKRKWVALLWIVCYWPYCTVFPELLSPFAPYPHVLSCRVPFIPCTRLNIPNVSFAYHHLQFCCLRAYRTIYLSSYHIPNFVYLPTLGQTYHVYHVCTVTFRTVAPYRTVPYTCRHSHSNPICFLPIPVAFAPILVFPVVPCVYFPFLGCCCHLYRTFCVLSCHIPFLSGVNCTSRTICVPPFTGLLSPSVPFRTCVSYWVPSAVGGEQDCSDIGDCAYFYRTI